MTALFEKYLKSLIAVSKPPTKKAPIASFKLYPLPVAIIKARPAVDHAVATGYLNFQERSRPLSPIAKPSAQNQEVIC